MNTLSKISIAIVDDHPVIIDGLTNLLPVLDKRFEISVTAGSGETILQKLTGCEQPDICIVDINLPGMNGYETMLAINRKWPAINTIAFSFHDDDHSILQSLKSGARGYLTKGAPVEEIYTAIDEVYCNEYYFSPLVLKKFPKMNRKTIRKYIKQAHNEKETTFLQLCCSDLTYEQIAERMGLSPRTIEKYCTRLKDELNIHSRAGLVMYALYTGIGKYVV